MFREYFIDARDFLREQGMNPVLRQARAVSAVDIELVDKRTDRPMPVELRHFYIEMGDAFEFVPDDVPDSPLGGWESNRLSDYEIHNSGFSKTIEEESYGKVITARPRVDPQFLQEKAEKRKLWVPF